MEFDRSRVYTALNADELKIGSKVYVAYNLKSLRDQVIDSEHVNLETVEEILAESYEYRFRVKNYINLYPFAYLVSEPEEKKLKVSDLKLGDIVRHKSGNLEYLVTGIDYDDNQVFIDYDWYDDEELGNWEKVEK